MTILSKKKYCLLQLVKWNIDEARKKKSPKAFKVKVVMKQKKKKVRPADDIKNNFNIRKITLILYYSLPI